MSNTTVTTRSAAEEAALAEVRRLQEEARRLERERLQVAQVRERIGQLDRQARQVTAELDEAAQLPDLSMRPLEMPAMPNGAEASSGALTAYERTLQGAVSAYKQAARLAIEQARRALQRRRESARLWRAIVEHERHLAQLHTHCNVLGRQSGEPVPSLDLPCKPDIQAELELVQAHHKALRALLPEWESRRLWLGARRSALAAAARAMGSAVTASSALQALQAAESASRAEAKARLEAHLHQEMARHGLSHVTLPESLTALLDYSQDLAALGDPRDLRPEVSVWLAREAAQRQGVAQAESLLRAVPEGVNEDPRLRQRWHQLAMQLQRVLSCLDPMTPSLHREHMQLTADVQRHVNLMLARADWVLVMTRAGCEVLEREDGFGLVVIDLDHPEVYLDAQEYTDDDGGFAVSLELKAEPGLTIADEQAVTDAVCHKLQGTASHGSATVNKHSEVVERKNRITRSRRPCVKRPQALQIPFPN